MTKPRPARMQRMRMQRVRMPLLPLVFWVVCFLVVALSTSRVGAQEAEPAPPVDFAFVVDTSGSMFGEPLQAAADAGRACLSGLPPGSAAAVVGYASKPSVLHPLSPEVTEVAQSLNNLVAVGDTATHDALIAGSRQFDSTTPTSDSVRSRYVVLLSDGSDTASQRSADDALAALGAVGARLWVVAVETGDLDLGTLEYLAGNSSGGGALIRTGPSELVEHCTSIARLIVDEQRELASGRTLPGAAAGQDLGTSATAAGSAGTASDGDTASILGGGEGDVDASTLPLGDDSASAWAPATDQATSGASGLAEVPLGQAGAGESAAPGDAAFPSPPPMLASTPQPPSTSARALWIGAGAIFASMATMLGLVFVPSHSAMVSRSVKLRVERSVQDNPRKLGGLGRVAGSAAGLVESIMNRRGLGASLNDSLDAAGIDLRPSEFVAGTAGLAIVVSILGSLLANPVVFAVGAIGIPLLARQFLKLRKKKRTKAFQEQLVETLMIMAGSVRAGHGLMQSINAVAEQASEPTTTEFGRVITEVRIGRDPIDSLNAMAARVDSVDLTWTVRAMALNRELGGNLAEILDNVADTIRERNKIADQVRALSAEGKFSAYVLFGLPFGVVFAVRILNPEYIEPLFTTNKGYVIVGVSLGLMTIGAIWIRKMIQIEY